MTLGTAQELANTQRKLARLKARYEALRAEPHDNVRVPDLTMTSLKRLINQFKEEIALYHAHQCAQP